MISDIFRAAGHPRTWIGVFALLLGSSMLLITMLIVLMEIFSGAGKLQGLWFLMLLPGIGLCWGGTGVFSGSPIGPIVLLIGNGLLIGVGLLFFTSIVYYEPVLLALFIFSIAIEFATIPLLFTGTKRRV